MGSGPSSDHSKPLSMGRLREDRKLYKLVDIHGGGEIVPWLRYAMKTGDNSFIDGYIDTRVREFLYNQGKAPGKLFSTTDLVKLRNKERNERLNAFSRKKGKGKSGPNVLEVFNQEGKNVGDVKKAIKIFGGCKEESREVLWKLDERGSMGETIIGVCLLQSSDIHNRLALTVLDYYPNLVNDINVSEDYYGLTPLHQAIINQDPAMVFTLLMRGADVNTRCYGAFFCAEDQRSGRTDSLEHEYVDLPLKTNYTGNMYYGEYPLSFAACLNQADCFKLLLAKKANPNAQDTNGNTVLHMCVIHKNQKMFKLALQKGANIMKMNKQKLTPLTLAAKLGNQAMFNFILELEGERVWAYGGGSSVAYPLAQIDSVDEASGEINENSALSLAVYGETPEHLDLLDGLLDKVVEEKWNSFGRRRLLLSLLTYFIHWLLIVIAFFQRPISWSTEALTEGWITRQGKAVDNDAGQIVGNERFLNVTRNHKLTVVKWTPDLDQCHLRDYFNEDLDYINASARLAVETAILISVAVQIVWDFHDIKAVGWRKWCSIMGAFPAKIAYKISYIGVVLLIPIRASCSLSSNFLVADNVISILTLLLTTLHFLFYCRALPFVGPFVLMIYRIIHTDIRRFLMIYGLFLTGFAQAFYVVFITCERESRKIHEYKNGTYDAFVASDSSHKHEFDEPRFNKAKHFDNLIHSPYEAFIRTFIMTIGEFMILYRHLALCPSSRMIWVGKLVFLLFETCVSVLQFNLLIGMMTRTYETIFKTKKEYKRQFARVILMLEVSLSHKDRLMYLLSYSRPIGTNTGRRSLVVNKVKSEGTSSYTEQNKRRTHDAEQANKRRISLKRLLKEDNCVRRAHTRDGSSSRSHTTDLRSSLV